MAYTTIDDGSAHFHAQTYTGNGSSGHSITNNANAGDFKPDWLIIKPLSSGDNSVVFDSTRGSNKQLKANGNDAEDTHSPARVTFETDGFDLDTTDGNYNGNGTSYVAWQWKCNGGTTSTNNDGSVAVTLQTSSDAGFSIGTFTGAGNSSGTIGHGLSAKPDWLIVKRRDGAENWNNIFANVDSKLLRLNTNGGSFTGSAINSVGTSTFTDGNGDDAVFYAFKSIQGYSRFGEYVGNGNADGTFIYLGFKPKFFLLKRFDASQHWYIFDSARSPFNPSNSAQQLSSSSAQETGYPMDFLSNGFKIRHSDGAWNSNGQEYVYAAFAEHPFVSSKGVPATAR